jgi:hypothetical protein
MTHAFETTADIPRAQTEPQLDQAVEDYNSKIDDAMRQGVYYADDATWFEGQLTSRWNGLAQSMYELGANAITTVAQHGDASQAGIVMETAAREGVRTNTVQHALGQISLLEDVSRLNFALDVLRLGTYKDRINAEPFSSVEGELKHARQLYLTEGASSDSSRAALDAMLDKERLQRARQLYKGAWDRITPDAEAYLADASSPTATRVLTAILTAKRPPQPVKKMTAARALPIPGSGN